MNFRKSFLSASSILLETLLNFFLPPVKLDKRIPTPILLPRSAVAYRNIPAAALRNNINFQRRMDFHINENIA